MRIIWMASVAMATALVGCGSVADNPDAGDDIQAGDFGLMVDPTTLTLPVASTKSVTVTVERSGSVDEITLDAPGLPSNLTATFTPSTLPAGVDTAELKISAVGGIAPATSDVTVEATAGNVTHVATVTVTTANITVTGTVRGGKAGVTVGLIGKPAVISGAGGSFVFTDVTPPYDLYTVFNGGTANNPVQEVYYFDDLTRPDPTVTAAVTSSGLIVIPCGFMFQCPASNISGTRGGTSNATDPVIFAWSTNGVSTTLGANNTFALTGSWVSGSTNQGNVHGLQFTRKASGGPDVFIGYARSGNLTLTDGMATTNVPLTFTAVGSSAAITGTITPPAGYPAPTMTLYQEFGNNSAVLWTTNATTSVDANFPLIPNAGGNSFFVTSNLSGSVSNYVYPLSQTADVSFVMPAAAVLTSPAAGAVGVSAVTPLTWTAPDTVVNEVVVSCGTGGVFHTFTKRGEATIAVVPEAPLPAAKSCTWEVRGYGPFSSVNDAAAASALEVVNGNDSSGPPHAATRAPSRSFTTP